MFPTSSTPGDILNLVKFPAASRKAIDDVRWHDMARILNPLINGYVLFTIVTLRTLILIAEAKSQPRQPYSSVLKY